MASFDLKPQGATNNASPPIGQMMMRPGAAIAKAIPSGDQIVWTLPRSPAPPQLEGRVSDSMWAATWDKVTQKYIADMERQKDFYVKMFGNMPMCPCCPCCLIYIAMKQVSSQGELREMSHEIEQAWLALVGAEHEKWSQFGVAVTIAQELRVTGNSNGGASSSQVKCGLTFSLGPAGPSAPLAYAAYAPPLYPAAASSAGGADIGSELQKLNQLRREGALSETEFEDAKAVLLGGR